MRKAYLETSAINRTKKAGFSGRDLSSRLESLGFSPAIGIHTIYELAATFLSPGQEEKAVALFSIVQDLDPSYQRSSDSLLQEEILKLRTGAAVLPFLDYLGHASTRTEVGRLALGIFDQRARCFIRERESQIRVRFPNQAADYLQNVVTAQAHGAPCIQTFEEAYQYFESKGQLPALIRRALRNQVAAHEARELHQRLEEFPAIRALVRATLYMDFIFIKHRVKPNDDKLDDYRHIIEATYCDAFVADDNQLLKTVRIISPHLYPLSLAVVLGNRRGDIVPSDHDLQLTPRKLRAVDTPR